MKKILIAGGAGFIGTNLYLRWMKDNLVTVIDDFSSSQFRESLNSIHFIQADISKPIECGKFDIIINLACMASPKFYQQDPLHTLQTCFNGTLNLLKMMDKDTIFVQASTSEVYGESLYNSQSESDRGQVNCFGPRACYDEGKRVAETLCYEWIQKGYNVKIIRIFNTYGPYMRLDDGRVITNLLSQAMKGEPLTIYGDGTQTRSFQYIDDLIDGIEQVINCDYNKPINLGNPNEITINELASYISNSVEYKPLPIDDPTHRKPDISLAKELFGYNPTIDIKTGIKRTLTWIKKILCA